jgi:hypothetical protein
VQERKPVGIFSGLPGRLVHQAADRKMCQQQAVEFLSHQVRRLAAQDDLRSAQVGLQFVQGGLSGKGLARYDMTTPPVSSPSPSELLVRFSLKQLAQ